MISKSKDVFINISHDYTWLLFWVYGWCFAITASVLDESKRQIQSHRKSIHEWSVIGDSFESREATRKDEAQEWHNQQKSMFDCSD